MSSRSSHHLFKKILTAQLSLT
uniref:Uncharacterized protein n=1 Tax=Anguilla anguilla TaxID=7936 RepID=A0A0E9U3I2_ANGAN